MILVTTLITPPILRGLFIREKAKAAARTAAMQENEIENQNQSEAS
jgi:hypothetical protein